MPRAILRVEPQENGVKYTFLNEVDEMEVVRQAINALDFGQDFHVKNIIQDDEIERESCGYSWAESVLNDLYGIEVLSDDVMEAEGEHTFERYEGLSDIKGPWPE